MLDYSLDLRVYKTPSKNLAEATRRIASGICAVPSVAGSKAPSYLNHVGETILLKWHRFMHRKLTPWEIGNYFQPSHVDNGRTGVGIIGGKYSIVERDGTLYAP